MVVRAQKDTAKYRSLIVSSVMDQVDRYNFRAREGPGVDPFF